MKILILITVVAMATVGNAGYSCPEFWNLFGGNCYRYRGDRLTWSAAEARCNEDSTIAGMGHLASIHSLAENRFVYEMFKSSVSINDIPDWVYSVADRNPLYGIWTGLHQAVADGPWKNSDGTDQGDFFKWMRAEEPNNDYYGGEEVEDCVHIFRYNDASDIQQGWNDIYCNEVMSFVCKMPADMESFLDYCPWPPPYDAACLDLANQEFSLTDMLNMGIRSLEIDPWWCFGKTTVQTGMDASRNTMDHYERCFLNFRLPKTFSY
eukprot:XP_011662508.1 PREDICTED: echinoidin-like [Strongylocentrotus purpuratus]